MSYMLDQGSSDGVGSSEQEHGLAAVIIEWQHAARSIHRRVDSHVSIRTYHEGGTGGPDRRRPTKGENVK